jgi:hypothetical protein
MPWKIFMPAGSKLKIFMPAGAKEPVYAPYVEHMPPDVTACGEYECDCRGQSKWRQSAKEGLQRFYY